MGRRRDRERRCHAALPRHGHRYGQGHPRRAPRHRPPPLRRPRCDPGGGRRPIPVGGARGVPGESTPADDMRSSSAAPVCTSPASSTTSASLRGPRTARQTRGELADEGASALYARLHERDPRRRGPDRPAQRPPHRARPRGAGAGGERASGLPPGTTGAVAGGHGIIGLRAERAALVERLDRRVERMWQDGMLLETARLREAGLERGATASRAIGYAQALAQLTGELTEQAAIDAHPGAHPSLCPQAGELVQPLRGDPLARHAPRARRRGRRRRVPARLAPLPRCALSVQMRRSIRAFVEEVRISRAVRLTFAAVRMGSSGASRGGFET